MQAFLPTSFPDFTLSTLRSVAADAF